MKKHLLTHPLWILFLSSWAPTAAQTATLTPTRSVETIPEIAIDLDASTVEIDATRGVVPGVTYRGAVRLLHFPAVGENTGFTGYNLKLQASPCAAGGLCEASTGPGSHVLDAQVGQDTSDSAACTIGRVLLIAADFFQDAPAVIFTFDYCVTEDVTFSFLADSPVYGLTTLGDTFLLQEGRVIVNSATILPCIPEWAWYDRLLPSTCTPGEEFEVGFWRAGGTAYISDTYETVPAGWEVISPPYDERVEDTIHWTGDLPGYTVRVPSDAVPGIYFFDGYTISWHWCNGEVWDTIYGDNAIQCIGSPTPTVNLELVKVDGFGGIHASPQEEISPNLACLDDYFLPIHAVRDVERVGNALHVLDMHGHVWTYSFGETCFGQIPNESQFNFAPLDVAAAIESTSDTGAYILLDTGEILAVGNAADAVPSVVPALPYRDGTPGDSGRPTGQDFVIPGPVAGPDAVGTISLTGGWNPESAVDFAMTGPDGALVLQRNGGVIPVGTASSITFEESHTPWIWPDLARKIEYMNVNGDDYHIVVDGLGGVHMAGPASSALRTSFNNSVLTSLDYFAAVVGGSYVGIDIVNDFVPFVFSDGAEIGIMILDGLGGIHTGNVPFTYEGGAYFPTVDPVPGQPYSIRDTAVGLSAEKIVLPQKAQSDR